MLKANENPSIVWPLDSSIGEFTGQWWVAHTKSRNEKALAHDLIYRNINYFLPMTWRVRRQKGRTIRSLLPLFSGYLFFCGQEEQRIELLRTNRVAGLITVTDQQKLIDELLQIQHALRAGAPLTPHKYIKIGQHCRVIGGPLYGLHGIVIKTKTATRLVLQVDILGRATSVEIDSDVIEIVHKDDWQTTRTRHETRRTQRRKQ
ncbi:MAG: transcription termination/antitermination protein NusG [Planctomycetota bacterium]